MYLAVIISDTVFAMVKVFAVKLAFDLMKAFLLQIRF